MHGSSCMLPRAREVQHNLNALLYFIRGANTWRGTILLDRFFAMRPMPC